MGLPHPFLAFPLHLYLRLPLPLLDHLLQSQLLKLRLQDLLRLKDLPLKAQFKGLLLKAQPLKAQFKALLLLRAQPLKAHFKDLLFLRAHLKAQLFSKILPHHHKIWLLSKMLENCRLPPLHSLKMLLHRVPYLKELLHVVELQLQSHALALRRQQQKFVQVLEKQQLVASQGLQELLQRRVKQPLQVPQNWLKAARHLRNLRRFLLKLPQVQTGLRMQQ